MDTMKIYVSSVAFLGQSVEELVEFCTKEAINLEFSSGLEFHPDMEQFFLNYAHPKLAHNYFPAPQISFVLNLASANEKIREVSIQHCINGLKLTKKAKASFFAAHAGFCIDPNPDDLGKQLEHGKGKIDKEYHWDLFIKSVKRILAVAEKLEVDFYIENNVIAKFNIDGFGQNPLLCCDDIELNRLIKEVNHPRLGILLDTAHLKVSAQTLDFEMDGAVENLTSIIKAIHHSDNDGLLDSNQPLTMNYWFRKHLTKFQSLSHVIEVKKQTLHQLKIQEKILNQA
jgi:sugar phosphate isomerase/epimerase